MNPPHIPVLLDEILTLLEPQGCIIDATVGAGGHAYALLEAGAQHVLGIDVDPQALALAKERLEPFQDKVTLVNQSYNTLESAAAKLGWETVNGILLDLGVSSMQLDMAHRGFAFRHDGPLDMRFAPGGNRPPASEIVNYWDEHELHDIFKQYGEERFSKRIAQHIIANRPFETTHALAEVIAEAVPRKFHQDIHPATRVFQALRIAVNDELNILERTLPIAIDLLESGGRLAVISFHSLEDRIVKRVFKEASSEVVSPPGMILEEKQAMVKLVIRKPIVASMEEAKQNPRSRSAKLRVVEKL